MDAREFLVDKANVEFTLPQILDAYALKRLKEFVDWHNETIREANIPISRIGLFLNKL